MDPIDFSCSDMWLCSLHVPYFWVILVKLLLCCHINNTVSTQPTCRLKLLFSETWSSWGYTIFGRIDTDSRNLLSILKTKIRATYILRCSNCFAIANIFCNESVLTRWMNKSVLKGFEALICQTITIFILIQLQLLCWVYFIWILGTCLGRDNLSSIHVPISVNLCFLFECSCSTFGRGLPGNNHAIVYYCLLMEETIVCYMRRSGVISPWTCYVLLRHIVQISFCWIRSLRVCLSKRSNVLYLRLRTAIASSIQICTYVCGTIIVIKGLLQHSLKTGWGRWLSIVTWLLKATILRPLHNRFLKGIILFLFLWNY